MTKEELATIQERIDYHSKTKIYYYKRSQENPMLWKTVDATTRY